MINKIAAGEVVERPSSVVKELVENSIDAGAKAVTIEITDGGTTSIRITDNGCGISKDEVRMAFVRHATSKLSMIEDFESLETLGFRGEALSSISSVSQVELVTKRPNDLIGTRAIINGGVISEISDVGSADGTTFMINNLFYNTPARRKFLKRPATESGYISEIVQRLALSHPEIAFRYINNHSTLLQTSGNGDLKTAIFHVFGKDTASKLIAVSHIKNGKELTGYIGKPEIARGNRSYECLFINGRFIKSGLVADAVEEAYKDRLMTGKYPFFVLMMKTDPSGVDVNVHPTKLEVRFEDEDDISEFVQKAITTALMSENLVPHAKITDEKKHEKMSIAKENLPINNAHITDTHDFNNTIKKHESAHTNESVILAEPQTDYAVEIPDYTSGYVSGTQETESINPIHIDFVKEAANVKIGNVIEPISIIQTNDTQTNDIQTNDTQTNDTQMQITDNKIFEDYRLIGQIFGTYWLIEQEQCMYVMDQHAAHEKVLYEQITESLKKGEIISQRLLMPETIKLNQLEAEIVRQNMELFIKFGFEAEEFGDDTYIIRELPYIFNETPDVSFFREIVDEFMRINKNVTEVYEYKLDKIATIACKAAVKGNDRITEKEADELMKKLMTLKNPFCCPHGRPTVIKISKYEMEKKFKRVL